jgi:hypothetical protein
MTGGRKLLGTPLFPLSFRNPYYRVIPNVVRNPQLGMMNAFGMDDLDDLEAEDGNCMKTEACAHESTAGGGEKLEEIPRRCAPRNAPFPVSFRTDVRNLQLGIQREAVQNSMRFLVAALLGMTGGRKLLGTPLFPLSFRNPYSRVIPKRLLPCHSERSEESAVGNDECLRHG